MSTVKEIESAIERLDNDSLGKLSHGFEEYSAEKWGSHFADDATAGRLDYLGAADKAFEQGKCPPL